MKKVFALAAAASLLVSLTGCTSAPKEDLAACDTAWDGYIKMLDYYPKAEMSDGSLTSTQAITYLAALQVYAESVTAASKTVSDDNLRTALNGLAASVSTMQADFQANPLSSDKSIIAAFTASQDALDVICKGYGWKTDNFGKL